MKKLITWAIQNSPALNTFVISMLAVGVVCLVVMRREVFPNFALEIIGITVPFPGATPEEVEEGICQKIEAVVSTIDGVRKVSSTASENFGFVILELQSYVTDVQKVVNDIRAQVDQISTFPPRAEDPQVVQFIFRAPAITLGIVGPPRSDDPAERLQNDLQMRDLAESIRQEVLDLQPVPPKNPIRAALDAFIAKSSNAVTSAEIVAAKPFEVAIEIPEDTLREYGISLSQLAGLVRMQNIEMPGGKLESAGEEVLLRGKNKREIGSEIAKIPVFSQPNGDVVTVGDLGVVVDGFDEAVSEHRINERPGMAIRVSKTSQEDLFTIVNAVKEYVAQKQMPAGYQIRIWGDNSLDVRDRMDLLMVNGLQGLTLVFLSLAIFLEIRLAFWVAVGIPVSLLGACIVLLAFGQTLNMLTLFSFLMALGIVVDDAIVIGENIYSKRELGLSPIQAAIEGTLEVIPSVFSSVTTTVIAFVPLMFVTGIMGKFIAVMPLAIIAMLCISLVEATFVLPSHIAHENNLFYRALSRSLYAFRPLLWVLGVANKYSNIGLDYFVGKIYEPSLIWSLNHKRIVLATVSAIFMGALALVISGIAPFAFFPKMDGREISATIAFPNGTAADFSIQATQQLEQAIRDIDAKIKAETGRSTINNVYLKIGEIGNTNAGPTGITNGSHVATVDVQLVQPEDREISSMDLISRWREAVPKIAGAEVLKFGSQSMGPGGLAIEFRLLAADSSSQHLDEATERCKVYLASKLGVFDIEDNSRDGKWEMILKLNELGRSMGLDENSLASTIRTSYFGDEVMRLQRGRHEVKLLVRYPKKTRQSMAAFESIRVRDSSGLERPLTEVAEIEYRRAFSSINRLNQRRSVTITADVDKMQGNTQLIVDEMKRTFVPDLIKEYKDKHGADLSVSWEGSQAETTESFKSMFAGFGVALLCMFVLLTVEFKSYIQPLIIMLIIPFGWLGAILGHAILGLELTFFSFLGLVALTGIIVNDSIVLVDFINSRIRDRVPLYEAVCSSGKRRFRPIMLTTLTTCAGLFPILLETSMQAQVLIPMAASIVFGLLTGSCLMLILVPIFYYIYGILLQWFDIEIVDTDEDAV